MGASACLVAAAASAGAALLGDSNSCSCDVGVFSVRCCRSGGCEDALNYSLTGVPRLALRTYSRSGFWAPCKDSSMAVLHVRTEGVAGWITQMLDVMPACLGPHVA